MNPHTALAPPASPCGTQPSGRGEVLRRISQDDRFVLAAHEGLDGDAIGSLVALREILNNMDKEAWILIGPADLPLPDRYRFLPLEGVIAQPPTDLPDWTVVLVDCGSIERNPTSELHQATRLLNIDHHHDNPGFGTVNYLDEAASCTAELIWRLLPDLDAQLTPAIAQALYVGLITDTGRFMYSNTSPTAHQMAAELIQAGVNVPEVYHHVYEEQPERRLRLLATALTALQRFDDGRLVLTVLSAGDFERAHAKDSDSEGIIDELQAIRGTKVAAVAREDPSQRGKYRVSLRAADADVDVSLIARAQGGGGHRQAAGFSTTLREAGLIVFLRGATAQPPRLHDDSGS